ncbi:MAG: hypothetical protein ACFFCV_11755 [Promethearchaeota archaeon]
MFGQIYEPLLEIFTEIFSTIFAWSNIILSTMFFVLANKIIGFSKKLEIKTDNIKIRSKTVEFKTRYGVFILGALSITSLFCIFQSLLNLCFNILPLSPFLSLLSYLDSRLSYFSGESTFQFINITLEYFDSLSSVQQFIIISVAIASFTSFCLFIVGLYNSIFKRIKHNKKSKWPLFTIGFLALSIFLGLPLMLRFITFRI